MAGQNKGGNQEQDLNQILKNRREKLANLQEAVQAVAQTVLRHISEADRTLQEIWQKANQEC